MAVMGSLVGRAGMARMTVMAMVTRGMMTVMARMAMMTMVSTGMMTVMTRMAVMTMMSTGMMTVVTIMRIITAGMSDMTLGVHSDFGMMNHCCSVTRWASGNTKAYYT